MQLLLLKVCEFLLLLQCKKNPQCTIACTSLLCISKEETTKQMQFMRSKFDFLHEDIQFDMPKCDFRLKLQQFETMVVFSPIFVADAKIISRHNFVVPLNFLMQFCQI